MTVRNSKPGLRYEALIELLRASEALWEASRIFFDRWDISPSQFNVLNLLHEQPDGCNQIELSRQLIMHRSNITGLVNRLEQRGLLQRRENPTDRRAFNVSLTPAGKKLVLQILPHYYQAAETVWNDTTPEHAQKLAAEMSAIGVNAGQIARNQKSRGAK